MASPLISICVPYYKKMPNAGFFIDRCLESIRSQTYQNYEIVLTEKGSMAHNTNLAIKQSKGDLIKILYMDDYFTDKDSLKRIVEAYRGEWMIHGCDNNTHPYWTDDIHVGNNKLGSPSCLVMKKGSEMLFDENLGWLLDCDLYRRLHDKYGEPTILSGNLVTMGIGEHQASNIMGDEIKTNELKYMLKKYV